MSALETISQSSKSGCRGLIGPSVLACDMSNLTTECKRVIAGGANYLHLDVMDGHFVPNLTFGAPIVKCLRKNIPDFVLDVHLMVTHPGKWVDDMHAAGADAFTFHLESEDDVGELIEKVKSKGMKVGVAIKPKTPVGAILPYVERLDQVLVMTVEPGFGGQSFMHDMMEKVKVLRSAHPDVNIQVDGGISCANIEEVAMAGANMIVAGTSIFGAPDCNVPIEQMKACLRKHGYN